VNKEKFDFMEVKPLKKGVYFVTLFYYKKSRQTESEYVRTWLEFDGKNWKYKDHAGKSYVCFIHKRGSE